jgi:hypothetical protein
VERDSGGFVALPWRVLDSAAYARLSHPARALLLEVARQYVRDNNGRLLLSAKYLRKRGWKSADVISRAKRELLEGGFIFQTVQGHRPNKASWYAVTWHPLDRIPGYDAGADRLFRRSAYEDVCQQNATLSPPRGTSNTGIAPSAGAGPRAAVPPCGAVADFALAASAPRAGNHLEMPSIGMQ